MRSISILIIGIVLLVANMSGSSMVVKSKLSLKNYTPVQNIPVQEEDEEADVDDVLAGGAGTLASVGLKGDVLIVSTVDGLIHGIAADKDGKRSKLWSLKAGGPMMTSMKRGEDASDYSVLPAVDGTLLVHHSSNGLRKTSVTARMLAEKTPFINDDGIVFSGTKKSRVMGVDVSSGSVLHDSDAAGENGSAQIAYDYDDILGEGQLSGEGGGDGEGDETNLQTVWLGRTDYTVRAFNSRTGEEAFNLSYSEVHPLGGSSAVDESERESLVLSDMQGDILVADRDSDDAAEVRISGISLGSLAASAFSVGSTGAGTGEEGRRRYQVKAQRVLHSGQSLQSTSLPLSSAVVLGDMLRALPLSEGGRTRLVRALLHDDEGGGEGGYFAVPLHIAAAAATVGTDDEESDENTQLTLPAAADARPGKSTVSLGEQLFRLAGTFSSPLLRQTSGRALGFTPPLLLDYTHPSKLREGEYDVPAPASGSEEGVDPVLGAFSAAEHLVPGGAVLDDDYIVTERRAHQSVTLLAILAEAVRLLETLLVTAGLVALALYAALFLVRRLGLPLPEPVERAVELAMYLFQKLVALILGYSSGQTDVFIGGSKAGDPLSASEDGSGTGTGEGGGANVVGSLQLSSDVLGYGSHGTVVYRGSLNGRPVAIKRMLAQFNRAANREIALLIRSDGHANVVRYFLSEQKGEFIYLALQLCHMSLKDFVVRLQRSQYLRDRQQQQIQAAALIAQREASGDCADESGASPAMTGVPVTAAAKLLGVPDEARVALHHIALGLNHLHSNRIVHRDIKPHNILLELKNPGDLDLLLGDGGLEGEDPESGPPPLLLRDLGQYVLKISDMGLSKQLDKDGSSFASMSMSVQSGMPSLAPHSASASQQPQAANPVGTIGWQAPELMALRNLGGAPPVPREEESSGLLSLEADEDDEDSPAAAVAAVHSATLTAHRRTQRVDIFSLGCVLYYVLIPGEHPYGQWFEREANIMAGHPSLDPLSEVPEAADLIARMLERRPENRPSAKQVCKHPFFWPAARRLDFLVELSDVLEHEAADAPVVIAIETRAAAVVGRSWDRRLDGALLEDMGKYRKYDSASVRDCLRVIRNKRNHFNELSEAIRVAMAPMPGGFLAYFEARFPLLFMHCVRVACRFLHEDKKFAGYCASIAALYNPQLHGQHRQQHGAARKEPGVAAAADAETKSSRERDALASSEHTTQEGGDSPRDSSAQSTPAPDEIYSSTSSSHGGGGGGGALTAQQFEGIVVWRGGALAESCGPNRGWMRDEQWWTNSRPAPRSKGRPAHLTRSSTDLRYRSRLCTHWEMNRGGTCPMRKKGKCDFAHGPLELRVKDNRREKWGFVRGREAEGEEALRVSGGEDVLGAARSIEKVRVIDPRPSAPSPHRNSNSNNSEGGGGMMQQHPQGQGQYTQRKTYHNNNDGYSGYMGGGANNYYNNNGA